MKNNAYLIFTKATIGTMFILIKEMVKISPLKVELNPADFIRYAKSKANLRISESFREKIQRHAKVISVKEAISFRSQDLKESAYDSEIIGDLDIKPVKFNDALGAILSLVVKQPWGEKGDLHDDGHANLFYVEINGFTFVTRLFRDFVNKYWYLDDWEPDRIGAWYAGPRVFSRH